MSLIQSQKQFEQWYEAASLFCDVSVKNDRRLLDDFVLSIDKHFTADFTDEAVNLLFLAGVIKNDSFDMAMDEIRQFENYDDLRQDQRNLIISSFLDHHGMSSDNFVSADIVFDKCAKYTRNDDPNVDQPHLIDYISKKFGLSTMDAKVTLDSMICCCHDLCILPHHSNFQEFKQMMIAIDTLAEQAEEQRKKPFTW